MSHALASMAFLIILVVFGTMIPLDFYSLKR
jgi:hypothetical protein